MTDRPLYRLSGGPHGKLPDGGNAGLWYDKFCNQWTLRPGACTLDRSGPDSKRRWIETVTTRPVGDTTLLDQTYGRRRALVESCAGTLVAFETAGRFVTGLGREHPVGNGFAWHPTLGTPYLPGSSVKGLVRSWALEEDGVDRNGKRLLAEDARRIFGEPEKGDERRAGSVIFLDALPLAPVKLEADVMTPHYQDYYQGSSPPADWLSPNPIPFLVVAGGTKLCFALLPRISGEQAKKDVAKAAAWLAEALQWMGAGAKTAVGYGRFKKVDVPAAPDRWQALRNAAEEQKLPLHERLTRKARRMSEQEALDWTRETLVEGVDRDDASIAPVLTVLIERFHASWLRGERVETMVRTAISTDKLRDDYAHRLVPPPSEEEQRAARFRHAPEHERRWLIEIHDTPSNQITNPLRAASAQAIDDANWTVMSLELLEKRMRAEGWNKKKSKSREHYKAFTAHLRERKKEQK